MSGWKKVKLGDVIENIVGGGTPSKKNETYWNGSIPWASVKDLSDNDFHLNETQDRITQEGLEHSSSNLIEKGTIILPTRMGLGRVVRSEIDVAINQDLKALYPKEEVIHPDYLLWLLVSLGKKIISLGTGSTVAGVRLTELKNIDFLLPNLKTQKSLAEIITAYDDLIENNQKRIKILEEMARRLYTEWFVKFRFPGYKDVKMVDSGSEFGEIPEGWEVKKLSDIGKVITGSTPSKQKPKYYGSEYMFIKTPDFNQGTYIINSDEKLSQDGFEVQKTRLLPAHTVMVTTIGTIGKVAITTEQSFTNQQINSLVLKNQEDYVFYYFFAKNLKKKLEGLGSNGATMGNVSKSKFESMKIIYPSTQLLADFFTLTSSNFLEIECLMSNNQYLVKMRDLLIENLVTGKKLLKN